MKNIPFAYRLLKGRIAETIICDMLQESGYFVYRFGYEGILQSLVQKGLPKMKNGSIETDKIRTMPDFIVMDKEGNVSFVEVKFRSKSEVDFGLKNWIYKTNNYWPESKIIMVKPTEPYFMISSIEEFIKTIKFHPLSENKYFKIDDKLIANYQKLVRKYFC